MKRRVDLVRVATIAAVALPIVLVAFDALARPGGGSSYSGGSRSGGGGGGGFSGGGGSYSGGGGGSGNSDGVAWLIVLCIEYPYIGIPIVIIIVVFGVIIRSKARRAMGGNEWTAGLAAMGGAPFIINAHLPIHAPMQRAEPLKGKLAQLQRTDPAFSIVVFEDFLYFLYAEMHRARGTGAAESLAAYVGDGARAQLKNDGRIGEVTGIIIGAMTYERVDVDPQGGARVVVVIESNYVERYRPHGEQRFYVKERITLTRAAGAKSRTPDKARILACPNCGGPLSAMRGKTCSYCNTLIESGAKDWSIQGIEILEREQRGPLLTSSVEEQGTNIPTVFDPRANTVFAQIQQKDPALNWQRVEHRVGLVFQEFHAGWVGRDASKVRPFVSDNLFQSQVYWIDLYKSSHCINRTDGSRITRLELASATTDAYFDALTIRLYATGLDYTVGEDGKLLSGSQSKPRAYSEYWTMIRGAQKKPSKQENDRACPNCGGPLDINMTGNCKHCGVKVTSGEYDWVLSRIEQDEAYTG